MAGGAAAWWFSRPDATEAAIAALEAPPQAVSVPSGAVTVDLPGGGTPISTTDLTGLSGQWGPLAQLTGAEALVAGTDADAAAIVEELTSEGVDAIPPVAVLSLANPAVVAPGTADPAGLADFLARQLADADGGLLAEPDGSTPYEVETVGPVEGAAGPTTEFVSRGPDGARGVRVGRVVTVGSRLVVVVVSAPTGEEVLARRTLERTTAPIAATAG